MTTCNIQIFPKENSNPLNETQRFDAL